MKDSSQESRRGSGRGAYEKENPRRLYAVGLLAQPAPVVRGSSRRINTLRFRPAYIRLINRRDNRFDCYSLGFPRAPDKKTRSSKLLTGRSISETVLCTVSETRSCASHRFIAGQSNAGTAIESIYL